MSLNLQNTFDQRRWLGLFAAILAGICFGASARAEVDVFSEYDLIYMQRPNLPLGGSETIFQDGLMPLWSKALQRPDGELKRFTINSLSIANQRNVKEITDQRDAVIEKLVAIINDPDEELDVVRASAQSLIDMNVRSSASDLVILSKSRGQAVQQIVEPAIAAWKDEQLKQEWLDRLSNPSAGLVLRRNAINGLGALASKEAESGLSSIAHDTQEPISIRIFAAQALGTIGIDDATKVAKKLLSSDSTPEPFRSVMAVGVLHSANDQDAIELLEQLSNHDVSLVQSKALEQLSRIDLMIVDRLADKLISSSDANVRRWCVQAMLSEPRADRVSAITPSLNDVNPTLRRTVTKGLRAWAQDEAIKNVVIDETRKVLANNDWRGCEQAIVLLTQLDHKPAGPRFVELLGHKRDEVKVASAWGLSKLRIKELLPDMLEHAQRVYGRFKREELSEETGGDSLQMAHLFCAFGDQMYRPADELARAYLPKNLMWGTESRAAACWTIGLFYEQDPPDDLIRLLTERIRDTESQNAETDMFRAQCAIAFGRWNAKSTLPDLRRYSEGRGNATRGCYWALEKITGDKSPPPINTIEMVDDWFLTPLPAKSPSP